MYNIRYAIPVCSFNELVQAVVKVLAQVLDVNCFDVISKLLPEPTKVQCTCIKCNKHLQCLASVRLIKGFTKLEVRFTVNMGRKFRNSSSC